VDVVFQVVHPAVEPVPAQVVGADQQDVAADPQHRHDPDRGEGGQDDRHRLDQACADALRQGRRATGEMESDVIHLHDQGDHAVHECCDRQGDDDQDDRPRQEWFVGHLVQRDDHDLGRQDEVGADRVGDHLVLVHGAAGRRRGPMRVMPGELLPQLLDTLVAQIRATEHEQRCERPLGELAEQEDRGQDREQFVADRTLGDPADDRQFALRLDALHVTGRHSGVVDDDTGRLGAGAPGSSGDVID